MMTRMCSEGEPCAAGGRKEKRDMVSPPYNARRQQQRDGQDLGVERWAIQTTRPCCSKGGSACSKVSDCSASRGKISPIVWHLKQPMESWPEARKSKCVRHEEVVMALEPFEPPGARERPRRPPHPCLMGRLRAPAHTQRMERSPPHPMLLATACSLEAMYARTVLLVQHSRILTCRPSS